MSVIWYDAKTHFPPDDVVVIAFTRGSTEQFMCKLTKDGVDADGITRVKWTTPDELDVLTPTGWKFQDELPLLVEDLQ